MTTTQTRAEGHETILSIVYPGDPPTLIAPQNVTTGKVWTTNASKAKASEAVPKWQREVDGQWIDILTRTSSW
jgi:hypothetical protein